MPRAILSTTAPFGYEIDPRRFLEAFAALGCTSCQFFRNREKQPSVTEALAVAHGAGMTYDSVHGFFGPDLDPSSPDAAHRAHCLKVYENEAHLALELGGPLVVVHPSKSTPQRTGTPPPPPPILEARRMQDSRWGFLDDFLKRLAAVGERLGVTFVIENLMFDVPLGHDPVLLAEHVLKVKSPRVRMCLDTGHAHVTLAGTTAWGRAGVGEAIKACAPALGYFHFHDNDGTRDAHQMPGRGGANGIDWGAVGAAMKQTGTPAVRMLEVFEDPGLSGGVGERLREWLVV